MNTEVILKAFGFDSKILSVSQKNTGHINSTFMVECEDGTYIIQRINKNVFKAPLEVMSNLVGITDHIRKKLRASGGDVQNGTLQFVKCGEGYTYTDEVGDYWRAYRFVEGNCYQSCESPEVFFKVGAAFGHFHRQLSDFDASLLYEVIPDFHNTVKRYEAFEAAVKRNAFSRVAECESEIAFARARRDVCGFIVNGLAEGRFPLRVTHNDTKLNNIIMHKETGEGLCVIDLDTVMPGSLLCDFGDAIRFGASTAAEDEADLGKVTVSVELFSAFTRGFLEALGETVIREELAGLVEGARVMALEQGMRFLTDYLEGDTYFRTHYAEHNLVRARNQLKLVAEIERKRGELEAVVAPYLA